LTFDLTGTKNPQLIFNFAADGSVEFFLNPPPNPWSSPPPSASSLGGLGYAGSSLAYGVLHAGWPITQSTNPGLVIGPNSLYAHVTNESGTAGLPSPTGLLVAGDVTADRQVAGVGLASATGVSIGTGVPVTPIPATPTSAATPLAPSQP
jgi:hypothetical protein